MSASRLGRGIRRPAGPVAQPGRPSPGRGWAGHGRVAPGVREDRVHRRPGHVGLGADAVGVAVEQLGLVVGAVAAEQDVVVALVDDHREMADRVARRRARRRRARRRSAGCAGGERAERRAVERERLGVEAGGSGCRASARWSRPPAHREAQLVGRRRARARPGRGAGRRRGRRGCGSARPCRRPRRVAGRAQRVVELVLARHVERGEERSRAPCASPASTRIARPDARWPRRGSAACRSSGPGSSIAVRRRRNDRGARRAGADWAHGYGSLEIADAPGAQLGLISEHSLTLARRRRYQSARLIASARGAAASPSGRRP